MEQAEADEENVPRRSLRSALAPLNNTALEGFNNNTPENGRTTPISPDEFIIEQRGRRRKPITWSPVDYNKTDILGPGRDRTPERIPQKAEINSKLRRRLTMSSFDESTGTRPQLGHYIERKLKAISDIKNSSKRRVPK